MNLLSTSVKTYARSLAVLRGPSLSTLIFHRVLPVPDPLMPDEPDARLFEARLTWVAATFRVLPLIEAIRRLRDGSLPANAACITFDDGYADNLTVAAPILSRLRLPATFFIATGYLDGGRMWNDTVIEVVRRCTSDVLDLSALELGSWSCARDSDRVATIEGLLGAIKYLPQAERQAKVDALASRFNLPARSDLMMTRQQLRELRRFGMSIGGHTVTHPILKTLASADARREIEDGRRDLEETLQERVKLFAYPNGRPDVDYDASHVAMVQALGFDAAVSTAWGVSDRRSDRYQLARFTPWDTKLSMFGLRLGQNLMRRAIPATPLPVGQTIGA